MIQELFGQTLKFYPKGCNPRERSQKSRAIRSPGRISKIIGSADNKNAADHLNMLNSELAKSEPNKTVLRTIWEGLKGVAPTVKDAIEAVAAIEKIIAA
jgi:hypothetical protein